MLSQAELNSLAANLPSPYNNTVFPKKTTQVTEPQTVTTQIKFPNPSGTVSVHVCGNWDQWKARTPLEFDDSIGSWTWTVQAKPGSYQCKFLVNGEHWVVTNMIPMTTDETGNNNNVIVFKAPNQTNESETAGISRDNADRSFAAPSQQTSENAPPIYKMYHHSSPTRDSESKSQMPTADEASPTQNMENSTVGSSASFSPQKNTAQNNARPTVATPLLHSHTQATADTQSFDVAAQNMENDVPVNRNNNAGFCASNCNIL